MWSGEGENDSRRYLCVLIVHLASSSIDKARDLYDNAKVIPLAQATIIANHAPLQNSLELQGLRQKRKIDNPLMLSTLILQALSPFLPMAVLCTILPLLMTQRDLFIYDP